MTSLPKLHQTLEVIAAIAIVFNLQKNSADNSPRRRFL
jgi:hypothetical protein